MSKVIVFTMKGCPWCQQLKEQFDEKGIEYEAKDVDEYSTMYDNFVKITESDLLPAMLVGKNALVPQKSFNSIDEAVKTAENLLLESDR
jgi:glutaredoxin